MTFKFNPTCIFHQTIDHNVLLCFHHCFLMILIQYGFLWYYKHFLNRIYEYDDFPKYNVNSCNLISDNPPGCKARYKQLCV